MGGRPNGSGGVYLPASVSFRMGANPPYNANITDPAGTGVRDLLFSGLALTGDTLQVTINRNGSSWIMITEIQFEGKTVPEPGTMLLLGTGLIGFAGIRRRTRK